jgi:trans-aconitate methyltransferase
MGYEKDADFYNSVYQSSEKYKKKPELIEYYYEVWCEGINQIKNYVSQPKYIMDLGCGPGHFASLLASNLDSLEKYDGYDFSETAINMAQSLIGKDIRFNFYQQDLRLFNFPPSLNDNSIITMFEFLEHISFDLELMSKIPISTWIVFSVPSFDSAGHVRWFNSLQEVKNRYEPLMSIENIYICNVKKHSIYLCIGCKVSND